MTSRLDLIEQRCGEATEGPWWLDGAWYIVARGDSPNQQRAVADMHSRVDHIVADAAFITSARTDLPELARDFRVLSEVFRDLIAAIDEEGRKRFAPGFGERIAQAIGDAEHAARHDAHLDTWLGEES